MTKYTVILIDDEQLALDALKWQLKEFCPVFDVVNSFTNPKTAHQFLLNNNVDLVFLDIDMPEMSGFDFLQLWDEFPFDVIFTTAYSEFAIKAFKVSAMDYLLKPIDEEELVESADKYCKIKTSNPYKKDQLNVLMDFISQSTSYAKRIALATLEGIHMVDVENIIRLEADSNYTTVYITEHMPIIVSKTLKDVEKTLDPTIFMRIHQSHTINTNKIEVYHKGRGGNVLMQDGETVPVSKFKKEDLLTKLRG